MKTNLNSANNPLSSDKVISNDPEATKTHKDDTLADPNSMLSTMHMTRVMMEAETSPTQYTAQHESSADNKKARDDQNPLRVPLINSNEQQAFSVISSEQNLLSSKTQIFLQQTGLNLEDLQRANISLAFLEEMLNKSLSKRLLRWLALDSTLSKATLFPFLDERGIQNEEIVAEQLDCKATLQKYFSTRVWIKGNSLPFKSERMIGRAYGVDSFYDGVEAVITRVWSLMLASFLANDFYNYYNYPDERYGATPSQIFFNQGDNEQALVTYLSRPEHWYGFLAFLGIPFSFGIIKAIYASYCIPRTLKAEKIAELTNFFTDPRNLNSENSNVFKAAWNWFSPLSKAPKLLETTREALLWNNQLTSQQRANLYRDFQNYIRHSHKFEQLIGIDILSDIASGMARGDFVRLARLGVDPQLLLSLLAHKIQALQELQEMAKHYQLPSDKQDNSKYGRFIKPLLRYLFAHYCLWSIGHAQSKLLQPFFWGFKAADFYVKAKFAVLIYQGIAAAIALSQRKKDCLDDGKVWQFINAIGDYNCTVCADFPIPYPYTFTMQSCLDNYLRTNRDTNEIIKLFNRIQNRDNITILNLSNQRFSDVDGLNNLTQIMPIVQRHISTLKEFSYAFSAGLINDFRIGSVGAKAIADFLTQSTLQSLFLSQNSIGDDGAIAISSALTNSQLQNLVLDSNNIGHIGGIAIGDSLPNSQLKTLNLDSNSVRDNGAIAICSSLYNSTLQSLNLDSNYIGPSGAIAISLLLPNSTLNSLSLDSNYIGDAGAIAIASVLPNSNLQYLELGSNDIKVNGTVAIAAALPYSSKLQYLGLKNAFIGLKGAISFSLALPRSRLQTLDLSSNNINAESAVVLAAAMPNFKLQSLDLSSNSAIGHNGATAIARSLYNSTLQSLDLSSNNIINDGAIAISAALPSSRLQYLGLRSNNIADEGAVAIAAALPNSTLQILSLAYNNISNIGAASFSSGLPQSMLKRLFLSNNYIGDIGAAAISFGLTKSQLQWIDLTENQIGDIGATAIGSALSKSQLQSIDLTGNKIGDIGATAIGAGLPASQLQEINLIENQIGDIGVIAISSGLSKSQLKILYLGNNHIGDSGAKAIADTLIIPVKAFRHTLWINLLDSNDKPIFETPKSNTQLIALSLFSNSINDTGAQSICKALPWTNIPVTGLYFGGNNVDQSIVQGDFCATSSSSSVRPTYLNFAVPFIILFYFISHLLSFTGSSKESHRNSNSRFKSKIKPKETIAPKEIVRQPTILLQQKHTITTIDMEIQVKRASTAPQEKPKVLNLLPQYSCMVNKAVVSNKKNSTSNPNKTDQEHVTLTVEQKTAKEQYALALELLYGKNIKRDPDRAIELLINSAKLGNLEAMYEIGDCYLSGTGFKQNDKKAAEWFGLAARRDHAPAQLQMGYLCEGGYGVEKDVNMAMQWFSMAAESGTVKAKFELTELEKHYFSNNLTQKRDGIRPAL